MNIEKFFFYFFVALQLHPDKNKHPKAEIAFKLVSEVSFVIIYCPFQLLILVSYISKKLLSRFIE
jgi:hypothetical protein